MLLYICLLFFLADLDHMQVPNEGSVPAEFDSLIDKGA
jgi:hypothetical protein